MTELAELVRVVTSLPDKERRAFFAKAFEAMPEDEASLIAGNVAVAMLSRATGGDDYEAVCFGCGNALPDPHTWEECTSVLATARDAAIDRYLEIDGTNTRLATQLEGARLALQVTLNLKEKAERTLTGVELDLDEAKSLLFELSDSGFIGAALVNGADAEAIGAMTAIADKVRAWRNSTPRDSSSRERLERGLPDRETQLRAFLAALAARCARRLPVPDGIIVTVIATDESGDFLGVGANCSDYYRDRMISFAAHGHARVDHLEVIAPDQQGVKP